MQKLCLILELTTPTVHTVYLEIRLTYAREIEHRSRKKALCLGPKSPIHVHYIRFFNPMPFQNLVVHCAVSKFSCTKPPCSVNIDKSCDTDIFLGDARDVSPSANTLMC